MTKLLHKLRESPTWMIWGPLVKMTLVLAILIFVVNYPSLLEDCTQEVFLDKTLEEVTIFDMVVMMLVGIYFNKVL